jgi:hypothetical protein
MSKMKDKHIEYLNKVRYSDLPKEQADIVRWDGILYDEARLIKRLRPSICSRLQAYYDSNPVLCIAIAWILLVHVFFAFMALAIKLTT